MKRRLLLSEPSFTRPERPRRTVHHALTARVILCILPAFMIPADPAQAGTGPAPPDGWLMGEPVRVPAWARVEEDRLCWNAGRVLRCTRTEPFTQWLLILIDLEHPGLRLWPSHSLPNHPGRAQALTLEDHLRIHPEAVLAVNTLPFDPAALPGQLVQTRQTYWSNGQRQINPKDNARLIAIGPSRAMVGSAADLEAAGLHRWLALPSHGGWPSLVYRSQSEVWGTQDKRHESGREPRTGLGVRSGGRVLVVLVADGRGAGGSAGLTDAEAAQIFLAAGCEGAVAMDGGGSSGVAVRRERDGAILALNHPCGFIDQPGTFRAIGFSLLVGGLIEQPGPLVSTWGQRPRSWGRVYLETAGAELLQRWWPGFMAGGAVLLAWNGWLLWWHARWGFLSGNAAYRACRPLRGAGVAAGTAPGVAGRRPSVQL